MIALDHSEHSYDYDRPNTVRSLMSFDPELVLIWNRRTLCFEVMRVRQRIRSFDVEGLGGVHFVDREMVWVTEFREGLLGSDDPWPLIRHMSERDMIRNPRLMKDMREKVQSNIDRNEARIRDNYRHAFRDSRRQLLKAWEPIFNFGVSTG